MFAPMLTALFERATSGGGVMGEHSGDALRADPLVQRALAVVLLRQALPLLDTLGEQVAAAHIQAVIDALSGNGTVTPPHALS